MKLKKDDQVLITTGKDSGKQGKIRQVFPEKGRVIVEGANIIKKHTKARGVARQAGIVEREAPLNIANVMLMCPKCHRPARVGFRFLADGAKERQCHRCGEAVD